MLAYLAESWDFSTLIHKIDCSLWFEILQRLIYNWQVTVIFRNSNILQYDVKIFGISINCKLLIIQRYGTCKRTWWGDHDFVMNSVTGRQYSHTLSGSSKPSCGRGICNKQSIYFYSTYRYAIYIFKNLLCDTCCMQLN